jgi:hypothetical protein
MGSLILPPSGPVYVDAQIIIYSVEKHPAYSPALRPLWEAVARGDLEVLTSELTLMETLVGPHKHRRTRPSRGIMRTSWSARASGWSRSRRRFSAPQQSCARA